MNDREKDWVQWLIRMCWFPDDRWTIQEWNLVADYYRDEYPTSSVDGYSLLRAWNEYQYVKRSAGGWWMSSSARKPKVLLSEGDVAKAKVIQVPMRDRSGRIVYVPVGE